MIRLFIVGVPPCVTLPRGQVPPATETFDLQATLTAVWMAFQAVVCNVGFQVAVHGLILACLIGALGWYMTSRHSKTGKPLIAVFRKLAIFCGFLIIPGLVTLLTAGQLPAVGQLRINSLGLIGFWSLVIAHLCMEEMNYEWFTLRK